ncbi:MAG: hypothetical protein RLZZ196_3531, partial [Bacteroidota bacterium]|jgi:aspartate/methionine/tyrosine aminotransferase
LQEAAAPDNVHAYQSYKGSPILRNAISNWYQNWYGVTLDQETEVLPLIGSKEGIMHICMTYLNAGDQALIPNPGYPTYSSAVKLAGGEPVYYDLTLAGNWEPDLAALEKTDLSKVKLMWVNYPHMPTGQLPSDHFFEALIAFATKHQILICHDNPYSFILNETPKSLLAVKGAKEVVVELNSLSKSSNMAGWRVGMLAGKKERIEEVLRFKSNMDSGMYLPIQLAAAKALSLGKDWYDSINVIYKTRREKVFELLDLLNCTYSKTQVGMFVWASIPASYADGFALSDKVLYDANVFITPGGIFGTGGNAFIRVSLCAPVERFELAIERVKNAGIAL